MAVSLESRIPFLDHHLYELAWRIPLQHKIKDSQGKLILREVLSRYVPEKLYERPKVGFGIPLNSWLRGPLRAWAEDLLAQDTAYLYLNKKQVTSLCTGFLSGQESYLSLLWNILMFSAWITES